MNAFHKRAAVFLVALAFGSFVKAPDSSLYAGEPCRPLEISGKEEALPQEWKVLLDRLHTVKTVSATFHETRFFSLRKHPVAIEGEIHFSRERGLSLLYKSSQRQLVVDEEGLLMRSSAGKTSGGKLPPEAGRIPGTLLSLFHFDWDTLLTLFHIEGCQEPTGEWRLLLTPLDPETLKAFRAIRIKGVGEKVGTIVLDQGPSQRVEIAMSEHQFNPEFTAAELKQYFR
ncbi:MAG: outer membrane lipoprotein carrier protein LolA [Verrucomicrobiota bacterium]|nr:outer membrane lipoprotein carrier protein LolA [Verrucomicrobiota bacterium]